MAAAVAPRVTKAEIDHYFELEERRKQLQRQAKDLAAEQEIIETKMIALVKAKGGKERTVLTCGYVLAITDKRVSVKWKDEYVRDVGSGAAESVIAAQPTEEVFSVKPVAKAA